MEKIDTVLGSYSLEEGPGFACGIIRNEEILHKSVRGKANLETGENITPETTFRLASVSKQFVATGILLMIQEKKLSFDDTLLEFFPDFPEYGNDITLRHLLTHASGLRDYEDILPDGPLPVDDEDVLAILQGQSDGYFLPGEKYRYSNGAYCLLHLILERITGQSLDLFLTERIFVPSGMDSAFIHTAGMPDTHGMAYGHSRSGTGYAVHNQNKTSWTIGDGGVYASLDDMLAWGRVLLSRRLGDANLEELFVAHVSTDEPGRSYGYGLVILETPKGQVIYHEGETVGFRICVYVRPADGLYVVTLFNRDDVDPFRVCEALADAVLG